MEDQNRGLESDQKEIPPLRGIPLKTKYLTIMVMRSVGKMYSFKISRRLIFWSSLFFIAYFIISLYIINSYIDLKYLYDFQRKRVESLETGNMKTKRNLLRTTEHVTVLEDYIQTIQEQRSKESIQEQKRETGTEAVERNAEDVYVKEEKEKSSQIAQIKDLVIKEESSGLSLDFKLSNAKPGEEAMEGYIHIIAMDNKKDPCPEWNYSKDMMKDGHPSNYRRGQPFIIQRFKPYHRLFNVNSNSELPSSIKVLVYDRAGSLLLEKEYHINEIS